MSLPRLLVIDPDPVGPLALREALGTRAEVEDTASLAEGLRLLAERPREALVLSLDFEAADMALVRRIAEAPHAPGALVLTTSQPTMQTMVEASRLGVAGVFAAPADPEELVGALREVFADA